MQSHEVAPGSTEIVPHQYRAGTGGKRPARPFKSPVRGVYAVAPSARSPHWKLRYRDPDTGRLRVETLSAEQSRYDLMAERCKAIGRAIQRRKQEVQDGGTRYRAADMPLSDAFARFFEGAGQRLDHKTQHLYRVAADELLRWCEVQRVQTCRQLTKARLREFSHTAATTPKMVAKPGGRRGERVPIGQPRSTHTTNRTLRSLSAVLQELRRADLLRLASDDLKDGLRRFPAEHTKKDFLRAPDIQRLLDACVRHDAVLNSSGKRKGLPKHEPVLDVVHLVLFGGLRVSEALALEGRDIKGTEIHVRAEVAKGGRARVIDCQVSDTLMAALPRWSVHAGRLVESTHDALESAQARLVERYSAPVFSWHGLRRTCSTYLCSAPGIFGGASIHMAATQLGHSVAVQQDSYAGALRIDPSARTLEAAMGLTSA